MAKPSSPLVGFNNNVKHHGRVFHVQTEDSGVKRPHIVTHLFADGGRIIKSTRTDYAEHLGRADMQKTIRRLMKEQHKAMFIALRDGQLNETINKVLGPSFAPAEADAASLEPPSGAPLAPAGARRSKPPPTLPNVVVQSASLSPEHRTEPSVTAPVQRRASPTLTDLVLADLESARARSGAGAPVAAGARPHVKGTPVLGTPATAPRPAAPAGRYAPSRPANIFSSPPGAHSLFGGSSSTISEQSLDEVILSYLAEDLDGTSED